VQRASRSNAGAAPFQSATDSAADPGSPGGAAFSGGSDSGVAAQVFQNSIDATSIALSIVPPPGQVAAAYQAIQNRSGPLGAADVLLPGLPSGAWSGQTIDIRA